MPNLVGVGGRRPAHASCSIERVVLSGSQKDGWHMASTTVVPSGSSTSASATAGWHSPERCARGQRGKPVGEGQGEGASGAGTALLERRPSLSAAPGSSVGPREGGAGAGVGRQR